MIRKNKFYKVGMVRVGEGDGDGENKGGDGDKTPLIETKEFKEALTAALANTQTDLGKMQTKNDELLEKLKAEKESAKQYEGIDVEKTKKLMEAINQSEEASLIAEGKFDEVMARRTDAISAKFQEENSTLKEALEKTSGERDGYRNDLDKKTIGDDLFQICTKYGVLPQAFNDVKRTAYDLFSINKESGDIESRLPSGEFRKTKDGKILTTELFVENLKSEVPHYWPQSQGSGSKGSVYENMGETDKMDAINEAAMPGANGQIDLTAYRKTRGDVTGSAGYTGRRPG